MEHTTRLDKGRNIRRSGQMVIELIAEYERSERTVKEFCADKGINTGTFYCWFSKHRNKQRQTSPAFVPVTIKDEYAVENVFAEYKGLKFYQPMSVEFFKALIG